METSQNNYNYKYMSSVYILTIGNVTKQLELFACAVKLKPARQRTIQQRYGLLHVHSRTRASRAFGLCSFIKIYLSLFEFCTCALCARYAVKFNCARRSVGCCTMYSPCCGDYASCSKVWVKCEQAYLHWRLAPPARSANLPQR